MNIPLPFQNLLGLLKYGLISQILYFLTIPIILKNYNPESYGIFSIAFAIVSVIGSVSSLRLERALVVEKSIVLPSLLSKCFLYTFISTLLCATILFFVLKPFELDWLEATSLIICGALYCLLFGFLQIFIHVAIRQKKLMLTGISELTYTFLLVLFLLLAPVSLYEQSTILIIIFTLSRLISLISYLKLDWILYSKNDKAPKFSLTDQYKYHIPVFTVLLTNLQFKGLLYVSGLQYGEAATGQLSIAQRIVYSPVSLFGASLRKSFFLEFTKNENEFQPVTDYVHKILNYGSILSLIIFPAFILITQTASKYIPAEWTPIIPFSILLYPVASILVLLSWLDRIYDAKSKQKQALFYEVIYTIVLYISLAFGLHAHVSINILIALFSIVTVLYNLVWAKLTLKMIKMDIKSLLVPCVIHFILLISSTIYLKLF